MNDRIENKVSMFLKVKNFLKVHEPTLAVSPPVITLKNQFDPLVDDIFSEAADASMRLKGYAEQKKINRQQLETLALQVSSALFAYWNTLATEQPLHPSDYTKRALQRYSASALHLRARQLHEAADPVKALLAPYNCAPADVDALHTATTTFFAAIESPKTARATRARANKNMLQLVQQAAKMLTQLDIYLSTFQHHHKTLFSQYRSARAIDNMRGPGKKKPQPDDE